MFEVRSKGERKETSIVGINVCWSKIKGSQSQQKGELERKSVVDRMVYFGLDYRITVFLTSTQKKGRGGKKLRYYLDQNSSTRQMQ